jgi:hypothetical protein
MATHGEKPWPPVGRFSGRLWEVSRAAVNSLGQFDQRGSS